MKNRFTASVGYGFAAAFALLGIYFSLLTLISGREFAKVQFSQYWYFIVSLAVGFGIQVGLFAYLKSIIRAKGASGGSGVIAVSGTTSTIAMISCCSHYLVNILPLLGVAAFASLVAQYQIELFWFGLAMNVFGIIYIARRIGRVNMNNPAMTSASPAH